MVTPRHPTTRSTVLLALTLVAAVLAAPRSAIGAVTDPAVDAQMLIYEINLSRWNPTSVEGIPVGTPAAPPLAWSATLSEAAMFKANEIADNGYFAHQSAVTGVWPNRLARDYGYALPASLSDLANNIESLHGGSPDPVRVVASFAASASHRRHIFGQGWFGTHREIGVGRSTNLNYWAVHTAYANATDLFITGVVYVDANSNGRMDNGEGLGGVTVSRGATSVTTNAGGGYAIATGSGTHTVIASGGALEAALSAEVTVGTSNVGVDFVSGRLTPIIRSYQLCQGEPPTILGTSGDDILAATPNRDVIHGLGGHDVVTGVGPDDVLCGTTSIGSSPVDGASTDICPAGAICDTVAFVDNGGKWFRYDAADESATVNRFYYGNPGDAPFTGDWDGDGVATPGLYRRKDGFAYLRFTNTQGIADVTFYFGNPSDLPIVGDFNGDGRDTVSIYRPSEGRVYIINRLGINGGGLGRAEYYYDFGAAGDLPFVGDFDGDGVDTIGLYRPSTGWVHLRNTNAAGPADVSFLIGTGWDSVFAGDWNGDGADTVAAYRQATGLLFLGADASAATGRSLAVGSFRSAVPSPQE